MVITKANLQHLQPVRKLLGVLQLPSDDLSDATQLFVLLDGANIQGTIGIEYDGAAALLRSLSVVPEKRDAGYGKTLVAFIEDFAKHKGVREMYLLTTTAASFFKKLEYHIISREEVPSTIKATSEFGSVCPASATVMKKILV